VKDAKCSTSISFFTFVVINAITPNSDGKNDIVDFTGISNYNNFAASIFDRYGQEVFKASKNQTFWNGMLREVWCFQLLLTGTEYNGKIPPVKNLSREADGFY
jgi:gliding motility-associated-like protein